MLHLLPLLFFLALYTECSICGSSLCRSSGLVLLVLALVDAAVPYLRLELYSQNLVVVRLQRHYIGLMARQTLQRSSFVHLFLHYLALQYHQFVLLFVEICCNISIAPKLERHLLYVGGA
jgi:hypothetical protein